MKNTVIKQKLNMVFKLLLNALRRYSIYKRLILSFLLIIIIPNLIIGFYSFNISSREMDKNISNSSKQILSNIEKTINEKLKFYEKLAYTVYSNPQISDLLVKCRNHKESGKKDEASLEAYEGYKKQIGSILFQISPKQDINNLEIVSDYDQFVQIDNNGKKRGAALRDVIAYTRGENYLKAIKSEGSPVWCNTSKEKDVFVVLPTSSSNLGGYITLLQSIPDPALGQNKQLGLIIINIPCIIFQNMVDLNNMYDENEIVFLSGKSGIVSILNGVYRVNKIPDMEILNEMANKKDDSIIKKISDTDYILVFHTSEQTDMVIVYMAERKKILNSVYNVRNIIIEVTLICILCALLMSYLVTSSISIPLKKLKKTIERVGENDLELKYIDNQKDEIGVLGVRFNAMISRIRNLLDNLIDSELSRKNEELRRKEAELDALQMQIKPHFMYNTLNLIRWNAIFAEKGEGTISNMIAAFSSLLRFNTLNTNRLVDINEEIEHLHAYVKVIKFKKEMNFSIKLELENDEILHCKITKLTFQPIVENAIKYGLVSLETEGVININAYTSAGELLIEIRDNGIGIPPERVELINDGLLKRNVNGGSIGLRNVNERIKLQFGEKYGLKVESKEGSYTAVFVHIPCVVKDK
jgi:two-component system, sensor histidine kinase YesM